MLAIPFLALAFIVFAIGRLAGRMGRGMSRGPREGVRNSWALVSTIASCLVGAVCIGAASYSQGAVAVFGGATMGAFVGAVTALGFYAVGYVYGTGSTS